MGIKLVHPCGRAGRTPRRFQRRKVFFVGIRDFLGFREFVAFSTFQESNPTLTPGWEARHFENAMKVMISAGFAAIFGLIPVKLPAEPAEVLLNEIIAHPGSYSQVSKGVNMPQDVPCRAFEISNFLGASFSKSNLAKVAENRDTLVPAIRARLLAIDFARPARQPSADPEPEISRNRDNFGCDPLTLNPLLLELIKELQAIEALPELLAVEQKLINGLAAARDDAQVPPPIVSGWPLAIEGSHEENQEIAKPNLKIDYFRACVAQRDLVILMALLMREKSYEPYLRTKIEMNYRVELISSGREGGFFQLKNRKRPEELKSMDLEIDSITGMVRRKQTPVSIPYTRYSRDEIRACAEYWVSKQP